MTDAITIQGLTYIFRPSPPGLTLFEYHLPSGKGPPRHRHDGVAEIFVVLSGSATLFNGTTTQTLDEGDTAFVLGGVDHAIMGTGDVGARLLALLSPGADAKAFYLALADLEKSGRWDAEAVVDLAKIHGVDITGPPLAPS